MKKLFLLLTSMVVVTAVVMLCSYSSFKFPDDIIYNYMDCNHNAKMEIELDDYYVKNDGMRRISVESKGSGDTFILADTVFDMEKENLFLILGFDNTIIYTAKDAGTSGSAIFAFDLDRFKKTKISSHSSIVNEKAFLGLRDILGLPNSTNDVASVLTNRGDMLIYDNKLIYVEELSEIVKHSRNADDFAASSFAKAAVKGRQIFFLNRFNELMKYDGSDNTIVRMSDVKIKDFYIDEDNAYCVTVKGGDMALSICR